MSQPSQTLFFAQNSEHFKCSGAGFCSGEECSEGSQDLAVFEAVVGSEGDESGFDRFLCPLGEVG